MIWNHSEECLGKDYKGIFQKGVTRSSNARKNSKLLWGNRLLSSFASLLQYLNLEISLGMKKQEKESIFWWGQGGQRCGEQAGFMCSETRQSGSQRKANLIGQI